MTAARALVLHLIVGAMLTLLSTFVGERSARAIYPDIMGCENGCDVVATGWPLVFVRDYLGMSVVRTADILEVWFAADKLSWLPFLFNIGAWGCASFLTARTVRTVRTRNVGDGHRAP